jgi:hypothetical protein
VLAKLTQQLGAGIPVYIIFTAVSVLLVRALVAARRTPKVNSSRRAAVAER